MGRLDVWIQEQKKYLYIRKCKASSNQRRCDLKEKKRKKQKKNGLKKHWRGKNEFLSGNLVILLLSKNEGDPLLLGIDLVEDLEEAEEPDDEWLLDRDLDPDFDLDQLLLERLEETEGDLDRWWWLRDDLDEDDRDDRQRWWFGEDLWGPGAGDLLVLPPLRTEHAGLLLLDECPGEDMTWWTTAVEAWCNAGINVFSIMSAGEVRGHTTPTRWWWWSPSSIPPSSGMSRMATEYFATICDAVDLTEEVDGEEEDDETELRTHIHKHTVACAVVTILWSHFPVSSCENSLKNYSTHRS